MPKTIKTLIDSAHDTVAYQEPVQPDDPWYVWLWKRRWAQIWKSLVILIVTMTLIGVFRVFEHNRAIIANQAMYAVQIGDEIRKNRAAIVDLKAALIATKIETRAIEKEVVGLKKAVTAEGKW